MSDGINMTGGASHPNNPKMSDNLTSEGPAIVQGASNVRWLRRNQQGQLQAGLADGSTVTGVVPVRAFPISEPQAGFSLVDPQGHEIMWVDTLNQLPPDIAFVLQDELQRRDFMPAIKRLVGVSSYVTPCEWHVDTDRGQTRFTLKGEEDIRRLGSGALLITDLHGIHYLLRDLTQLDKPSRKILDRFL